jgi:hypothetical protein
VFIYKKMLILPKVIYRFNIILIIILIGSCMETGKILLRMLDMPVVPATLQAEAEISQVWDLPGQSLQDPTSETKYKTKRHGSMAQVVEYLPNMRETLVQSLLLQNKTKWSQAWNCWVIQQLNSSYFLF